VTRHTWRLREAHPEVTVFAGLLSAPPAGDQIHVAADAHVRTVHLVAGAVERDLVCRLELRANGVVDDTVQLDGARHRSDIAFGQLELCRQPVPRYDRAGVGVRQPDVAWAVQGPAEGHTATDGSSGTLGFMSDPYHD
jgi:hypothetical protein